VTKEVEGFQKQVDAVKRDVQDLWDGMDYLSNPLN